MQSRSWCLFPWCFCFSEFGWCNYNICIFLKLWAAVLFWLLLGGGNNSGKCWDFKSIMGNVWNLSCCFPISNLCPELRMTDVVVFVVCSLPLGWNFYWAWSQVLDEVFDFRPLDLRTWIRNSVLTSSVGFTLCLCGCTDLSQTVEGVFLLQTGWSAAEREVGYSLFSGDNCASSYTIFLQSLIETSIYSHKGQSRWVGPWVIFWHEITLILTLGNF